MHHHYSPKELKVIGILRLIILPYISVLIALLISTMVTVGILELIDFFFNTFFAPSIKELLVIFYKDK